VYNSAHIQSADYNDSTWLDSFFSIDGRQSSPSAHEYHGWEHPGECNSQNYTPRAGTTPTPSTFPTMALPLQVVPAPELYGWTSFKYVVNDGPEDTASTPTSCSPAAGTTRWSRLELASELYGQPDTSVWCRLRVAHPHVQSARCNSWRAWNGTDFSVSFVDPY